MKTVLFILLTIPSLVAFSQKNQDSIIANAKTFQAEMNAHYADTAHSPLTPGDLQNFVALPFFPIDTTYFVVARFERAQKSKSIKFETSTDRRPKYEIYGTVYFEIKGIDYSLNVYQSHRLRKSEGYQNSLFLPFMDLTNGNESYGGGRYIDLTIPEGNTIEIDFNQAYNPYCAYSARYSCPVVQQENFIDVKINAGVKAPSAH